MRVDDFFRLVDFRLAQCKETLGAKSLEYTRNDDKLHNFKRAGALDGTSPTMALWGMWKKHIVSIIDMVQDIENGVIPSPDMVEEKLGDNINYTLLFEAMLVELIVERNPGSALSLCVRGSVDGVNA